MATRTLYAVYVNGQNITSTINPLLISLVTTDQDGTESDSASIELDDRKQMLVFPEEGAEMRILLQGVEVFVGKVDTVNWTLTRGGGSVLKISAKGLDTKSKVKEPKQKHIDKKKVSEAIKEAGKDAGLTDVTVDPELDEERDYYFLDNESPMAFAQRLADEIGGTLRIRNNKAVISKKGGGKSATGAVLPTIIATRGVNLIQANVTPVSGRTRYKKVRSRHYDKKKAKWIETEEETEDTGAEATHTDRHSVADEKEGKGKNRKNKQEAADKKGAGSVTITLNPAARAEGVCQLSGCRPGIDGSYKIQQVSHRVTRAGGTTDITLKQPDKSTGKDNRKTAKK